MVKPRPRVFEEVGPSHFAEVSPPDAESKKTFVQAAKEFCKEHNALTGSVAIASLFSVAGIWGGPHLFEIGALWSVSSYAADKLRERYEKGDLWVALPPIVATLAIANLSLSSHTEQKKATALLEERVQEQIAQGATSVQNAQISYSETPFWGWQDVEKTARYGMKVLGRENGVFKIEVTRDGETETGYFAVRPHELRASDNTPLQKLY